MNSSHLHSIIQEGGWLDTFGGLGDDTSVMGAAPKEMLSAGLAGELADKSILGMTSTRTDFFKEWKETGKNRNKRNPIQT